MTETLQGEKEKFKMSNNTNSKDKRKGLIHLKKKEGVTKKKIKLKASFKLKIQLALGGVAQWIECWPEKQRVTGSIPIHGTCLGCRLGPQ